MTIDATFWVAISFFIFIGGLIYLKIPQKINNSLTDQINEMKKEIEEAKKLKIKAKDLLSNYEDKIDKSKKESEETILEKTKNFYQMLDARKKSAEQKIIQMKKNALKDIKDISAKISIEAVKHLIEKSVDKNKLEKLYEKSLDETKAALKNSKV